MKDVVDIVVVTTVQVIEFEFPLVDVEVKSASLDKLPSKSIDGVVDEAANSEAVEVDPWIVTVIVVPVAYVVAIDLVQFIETLRFDVLEEDPGVNVTTTPAALVGKANRNVFAIKAIIDSLVKNLFIICFCRLRSMSIGLRVRTFPPHGKIKSETAFAHNLIMFSASEMRLRHSTFSENDDWTLNAACNRRTQKINNLR